MRENMRTQFQNKLNIFFIATNIDISIYICIDVKVEEILLKGFIF